MKFCSHVEGPARSPRTLFPSAKSESPVVLGTNIPSRPPSPLVKKRDTAKSLDQTDPLE